MSVSWRDIQRRRFAGPECLSAGAIFGECRSHSKTFKGGVLPAPNVGLLARYSANVGLLARYSANVGLLARYSANVGLLARYSANVCLTARHSKAAFFWRIEYICECLVSSKQDIRRDIRRWRGAAWRAVRCRCRWLFRYTACNKPPKCLICVHCSIRQQGGAKIKE